jgi:hypothetical protein
MLKLAQNRHQRLTGSLRRKIVDIASRKRGDAPHTHTNVKSGLVTQPLMQIGDRPGAHRLRRVQPLQP